VKKILLIEDNDDIRNNIAEILELSNYKVITSVNGKAGVAKAIEIKPDLILCDIMMPELDGYGALHAIKRNDALKNTPFIFLTAKNEHSDFRRGMDLGADDYITKPFDALELLRSVESRLTKLDKLREENAAGIIGAGPFHPVHDDMDILKNFTTGRNINKFKKKQIIYLEGNSPSKIYYVLKGKVKTFKTNADGKELVVELYCEGDFMGYTALIQGTTYRESAAAMEYTELAVIPKEDFDEVLNKEPELVKKFIQLLSNNISEKEDQLLGMAYNSLRKKVAEALLHFQRKFRHEHEHNFSINISRESLASIAGTATESLIRTLSDFRNEKLILQEGHGIIILDEKKLSELLN
jgi:CheY-like chemotaxis protein